MLKHENYLWSKLLIPAISSKNAKLPTKKFDQITTYISDFKLTGFGLDLLSLKQGRDGKNKIAVKSSSRQPKTPVSQAASSLSSRDSQAPDCTGNSPNKYCAAQSLQLNMKPQVLRVLALWVISTLPHGRLSCPVCTTVLTLPTQHHPVHGTQTA